MDRADPNVDAKLDGGAENSAPSNAVSRVERGNGSAGGNGAVVVPIRSIQLPSAPATETAVLLGMLERASADPTHDVGRMERLFALYEKAAERSARSAFIDALMRAKADLPRLIKTGSASYKDKKTGDEQEAFKYAKWEEVCPQIEPVLARHGLILSFVTEQPGADRVSITGILSHRDGHSERAQMALGCDASGGKNNAQGWGSAISYGKRYTSFALLNLVGHDDRDTDAAPPPATTISEDQENEIRDLIEATDASLPKFCAYFKIEKLGDLPAGKFTDAIEALRKRAR